MQWKTVDGDQFARADVANTAIAIEGHDHTLGKGLAVGRLNTSTALANVGDVFIDGAHLTYRDNQGTPVNQTVVTTGGDNTFSGINSFTGTLEVPVSAGAAPTAAGAIAFDSTAKVLVYGNGTSTVSLTGSGPTGTFSGAAFGTTDPANGFFCDGRSVSRSTYSALFSKIGTAYGTGDGSTTFNIPDWRSRIPMGADSAGTAAGAASRTASNNALGNTSGEDAHTLTAAESATLSYTTTVNLNDPTHVHGLNEDIDIDGGNSGGDASLEPGSGRSTAGASTGITVSSTSTTANAGGGAHNNRQLSQIANWVIWY